MKFVSIGPNCVTKYYLDNLHSSEGYPFDTIFSTIPMVIECIKNSFSDYLNKDLYIKNVEHFKDTNMSSFGHAIYSKMLQSDNLLILHHKARETPVSTSMLVHHDITNPTTYDSLVRKCNRFMKLFEYENDVCFVYIVDYLINDYDIQPFVDFLKFIRNIKKQLHVCIFVKSIKENKNIVVDGVYVNYFIDKLTHETFKNTVNKVI